MQVDPEDILEIVITFEALEDPRSHINRKHLLGDLIVICVCGVLSGCDGPIAIGQWAAIKTNWLKEHLELPGGIPSHDTLGRLLMALKPAAFQACFTNWLAAIMEAKECDAATSLRRSKRDFAATHRHRRQDAAPFARSSPRPGAMHLVSAWAVDYGVSLGQLATEEKSNEITAIPELCGKSNSREASSRSTRWAAKKRS